MGKHARQDARVETALHRAMTYLQLRSLADPQVYGLVEDDIEYAYWLLVGEGQIIDDVGHDELPSREKMQRALVRWAVRQPRFAHEQPLDYPITA